MAKADSCALLNQQPWAATLRGLGVKGLGVTFFEPGGGSSPPESPESRHLLPPPHESRLLISLHPNSHCR